MSSLDDYDLVLRAPLFGARTFRLVRPHEGRHERGARMPAPHPTPYPIVRTNGPSRCEPADFDGSGSAGAADLARLLGAVGAAGSRLVPRRRSRRRLGRSRGLAWRADARTRGAARTRDETLRHAGAPESLGLEIGIDGSAAMASRLGRRLLRVVASWRGGRDHVSVSTRPRSAPPTWEEMDGIARAPFRDHEVPVQLHVAVAERVDEHPNCLHLRLQQRRPTQLRQGDLE